MVFTDEKLPPKTTESTRLYARRSLSSSINGGGRVSTSIGGCVTGSTPQKSSVRIAIEKINVFFFPIFLNSLH